MDPKKRSLETVVVAAMLLSSVVWAADARVVDADALSRLALGRLLVERHGLPAHDPFTFAAPERPFGDPEWLGDLGLYAIFERFGEGGLQAAAISCGCAGYLLALALGMAFGASPAWLLGLLLSSLPAAAPRISPRNDVHLFWLFPLLGLLCLRAQKQPRTWLALFALGAVWSSVHSSFVLMLPFLALVLWRSPPPARRWGWPVIVALPLLPLLTPAGASSYLQLYDHVLGASVYRSLLSEWQSPLSSGGILAILPLYVLIVAGLAGLYALREHTGPWPWLTFGLGCALALSSRRFLPALAYLIVPASAGSLQARMRLMGRRGPLATAVLGLCLLAYLGLAARSGSRIQRASVFEPGRGPASAVAFVREHAPAGSRVANAFNDGPYLLWYGNAVFQHYLDPRNNLGAQLLARYVHEVLADGAAFEREAERLDVQLALVPARDPSMQRVLTQLMAAPRWRLVYWDLGHALFARDVPHNRALLERDGYRVLTPTLDLRYLAARRDNPQLPQDLARLDAQAPLYATVIRAYLELSRLGGKGPQAVEAAQVIARAWPALPETEALARALSELEGPAGTK